MGFAQGVAYLSGERGRFQDHHKRSYLLIGPGPRDTYCFITLPPGAWAARRATIVVGIAPALSDQVLHPGDARRLSIMRQVRRVEPSSLGGWGGAKRRAEAALDLDPLLFWGALPVRGGVGLPPLSSPLGVVAIVVVIAVVIAIAVIVAPLVVVVTVGPAVVMVAIIVVIMVAVTIVAPAAIVVVAVVPITVARGEHRSGKRHREHKQRR